MPIANGTHVGPYEIVGWLGAGGMGVVYRARDSRLGREVAIKLIPETLATDASRLRRFEQEARAAGQLNHPNVLAVYDVGTHGGEPYIVSELLEGESLRSRLQAGALPWRKAVDYARQTAEGLAAAHDRSIVHRDVKPENLLITHDGRVKILDFGIAKLMRPGDGMPRPTGSPTETAAGLVLGTAGYMSPEQVRGEEVDARSDIFSVGGVLHEMLTGRPAFTRATAAETLAAILKEDPPAPLPPTVPPSLERIVSRCVEKAREARFQSARDLAFGLECLTGTAISTAPTANVAAARRRRRALGGAVIVLSLLVAIAGWLIPRTALAPVDNGLASARLSRFTDWEGTEAGAEISPDGRFVAFVSDRDGQFDLWLSQVGTARFVNLTSDLPSLEAFRSDSLLRTFGFSGDGAEIWFGAAGDAASPRMLMPLTGGPPRAFLGQGAAAPSWSPDGARLVYLTNGDGDPLFVADRVGGDAHKIPVDEVASRQEGMHTHNPVWSPDGQWIYFAHGLDPTVTMDIWRIRPSGGTPEQLTRQNAAVNFLAPLDARTLLYVARLEDRSGAWLWALDVASQVTRRMSWGLEQYTSVSASRDGRRVVATVANPTASLWRVPLRDRPAEDRDVHPYPLPTGRALGPRFSGTSLFYLSARGTGDGLWRVQDGGMPSEVWKGANAPLAEPPAVSRDGRRVAVVVRREGRRRLAIMSADGTDSQTLAPSIAIQGAAGQAAADWSPDGAWIVAGGRDAQGQALFKIPVDGGAPVRLVSGQATNPVWSPDGTVILYGGPLVAGQVPLQGVRPDGSAVEVLSGLRVRPGGYRFLPNGAGLVYLPRMQSLDFWLFDLAAKTTRQLTRLGNQGTLQAFDITPDGTQIVFDRSRENSDIVLIELGGK